MVRFMVWIRFRFRQNLFSGRSVCSSCQSSVYRVVAVRFFCSLRAKNREVEMALPSKQSEKQSIPGGVTTLTHLGSPRVLRAKEKPSNDGKLSKKQVRCNGIVMRQSKTKWDVLAQSLEIEDPGQAQHEYMDNMIEALQEGEWAHWRAQFQDCCTRCNATTRSN